MNNLKDKYQIQETSIRFSFYPFNHNKKGLKWYLFSILILGGFLFYYFNTIGEVFRIIGFTFLFVFVYSFLKELIMIRIKYTFDFSTNSVYQSNIFFSKRKIMQVDEVVFFQSSEMGSWHYKMGVKRNQFVKNYSISENFGNDKKSEYKSEIFQKEILIKITDRIDHTKQNLHSTHF